MLEDKRILEAVDADAPVGVSRRDEQSVASDRPGMLMRKRLLALLHDHGEVEVHGWHRTFANATPIHQEA